MVDETAAYRLEASRRHAYAERIEQRKSPYAQCLGGNILETRRGHMLRERQRLTGIRAERSEVRWTPPLGVISGEVDRVTGELATAVTPASRHYTEYFVEGTEPEPLRADPWKLFRWGPIGF
jgi:hypothetical protein